MSEHLILLLALLPSAFLVASIFAMLAMALFDSIARRFFRGKK